jgi:glucokinase
MIFECCELGDKMAIEVFRKTGEILGLSLAGYASVLDPEAIILAGGVSQAGHWLLEPTNEAFEKYVFHNSRGHVKFVNSALDDHERDVLGASALAWSVPEYSLFK